MNEILRYLNKRWTLFPLVDQELSSKQLDLQILLLSETLAIHQHRTTNFDGNA
jgi:hypothetical protein